jgi:hypothetical protein
MPYRPTAAEVDHYRREGYLILRRPVFSAGRVCGDEVVLAGQARSNQRPGQTRIAAHRLPHWQDQRMFDWLLADEMLDIVEPLIGPDIGIFASHLLQKPPGVGKRVPWHEDSAYWRQVLKPMEVAVGHGRAGAEHEGKRLPARDPRSHVNGYSDYEPVARPEEQVFPIEIKKNSTTSRAPSTSSCNRTRRRCTTCASSTARIPTRARRGGRLLTVRYFPTHVRFDPSSHEYFRGASSTSSSPAGATRRGTITASRGKRTMCWRA